jgi:hypothetical protein
MKVFDNRELDLFGLNRAELRIYSLVSAGKNPLLHVTLAEFNGLGADPDGIADRLMKLVVDEAGELDQCNYLEVNGVKDNDSIYFGDAGFLMYQSPVIPDVLNMQLLVVESDQQTRNFALKAEEVTNSPVFKTVTSSIQVALTAANPVWGSVICIGNLALGILHNRMKNDKDDLVGYWQCTLNRREHYFNGLRDKQDVRDTTGNILVDYTLFGYENETTDMDATHPVSTV